MEVHAHQQKIDRRALAKLHSLNSAARSICERVDYIGVALANMATTSSYEEIFNTSEAMHRQLREDLDILIAKGQVSRETADAILFGSAAYSFQRSTYFQVQRMISIADISELQGQSVGVEMISNPRFIASIERGFLSNRWTLRISFGLLSALNTALLMVFDSPEERRSVADAIADFQTRMHQTSKGVRAQRYPLFSTQHGLTIERLGNFAKWFITGHELGHIVCSGHRSSGSQSDEEYEADHQGWLLYYGMFLMHCPPYDSPFNAGVIRTSWERWAWIDGQIPGIETTPLHQRGPLRAQFLMTLLDDTAKHDGGQLHLQMYFAPFTGSQNHRISGAFHPSCVR
jgi:hypothetical protein